MDDELVDAILRELAEQIKKHQTELITMTLPVRMVEFVHDLILFQINGITAKELCDKYPMEGNLLSSHNILCAYLHKFDSSYSEKTQAMKEKQNATIQ